MDFTGMDSQSQGAQDLQAPQIPAAFDPNKPLAPVRKPTSYYDLMLSLSDLGSKENAIKGQMQVAEELRKTPMPGMRQNGRIMKSAHPLEFANSALRQGVGASQRRDGMNQQNELANEIRRRIQEERNRGSIGGMDGPVTGAGGGYVPTMGE